MTEKLTPRRVPGGTGALLVERGVAGPIAAAAKRGAVPRAVFSAELVKLEDAGLMHGQAPVDPPCELLLQLAI